jgi:hypothetical protein
MISVALIYSKTQNSRYSAEASSQRALEIRSKLLLATRDWIACDLVSRISLSERLQD